MVWRTTTRALLTVLVCVVALSVAGPAGAATTRSRGATPAAVSQTSFAKTKFVIHAGLAFGAFKHFIYDPWKAGDFKKLFSHKIALAKAALAASGVEDLATPTLAEGETWRDVAGFTPDIETLSARGLAYEHLDQLALEHLYGIR